MDWPHDPDGEEGSEGGRKYGHAVIAKKVDEDEDFPLDVAAFVDEYGDDPVRIDHETVVSVRDIFEASTIRSSVTSSRCTARSARRCGRTATGSIGSRRNRRRMLAGRRAGVATVPSEMPTRSPTTPD
jgi:hypothetical protein